MLLCAAVFSSVVCHCHPLPRSTISLQYFSVALTPNQQHFQRWDPWEVAVRRTLFLLDPWEGTFSCGAFCYERNFCFILRCPNWTANSVVKLFFLPLFINQGKSRWANIAATLCSFCPTQNLSFLACGMHWELLDLNLHHKAWWVIAAFSSWSFNRSFRPLQAEQ